MPASDSVSQADRAAAAGNLLDAERYLEQAVKEAPELTLFLKLACLHRANGRPEVALESVHAALALAPRDFTALLLKASLLDRLGSPIAAQAWSHALANRPTGELPPHLVNVIAEAERARAAEGDE